MLNQALVQELKTILKNEFKINLNDKEVGVIGDQLVNSCEALIRLNNAH